MDDHTFEVDPKAKAAEIEQLLNEATAQIAAQSKISAKETLVKLRGFTQFWTPQHKERIKQLRAQLR
jgi:hypothetical protein